MSTLLPNWRLRQRPVATTAILVLSAGIAITTALLSVVQAVLLQDPPWPDADRLVMIHAVDFSARRNPGAARTWNRAPISWSSWRDLQGSQAFGDVGVWMPTQQIIGDDRAEFVSVFYTSSSFFHVLGVRPYAGRLFGSSEDQGMPDSALISYEMWLRRFGGRPDTLGSTISMTSTLRSGTERKVIVGILPAGFAFQGQRPEVMLPIGLMSFNGSFEQNEFLRAVGRLASGVTLPKATAVAEPLVRRLAAPDLRSVRLVPLTEDQFGAVAMPLWLLAAAAMSLLAISCSCVAGLLLADGSARRTEIAIRVSLGATRPQIFAQLFSEVLVNCSCGWLHRRPPCHLDQSITHQDWSGRHSRCRHRAFRRQNSVVGRRDRRCDGFAVRDWTSRFFVSNASAKHDFSLAAVEHTPVDHRRATGIHPRNRCSRGYLRRTARTRTVEASRFCRRRPCGCTRDTDACPGRCP